MEHPRKRKLKRRPDGQVAYTLKFYNDECPGLGEVYDQCEVHSPDPARNFKHFLLSAVREKLARDADAGAGPSLQVILRELRSIKQRLNQLHVSTAEVDSLEVSLSEQIEGYDLTDF